MYRIVLILLIFVASFAQVSAQSSREKARKMFLEGNYAEAKPLFKNLLKGSPRDGSYNYWYAVCCYETNDTTADVEKMLKYAVTRRVNNAHRYLGDLYKKQFRYDEAIESYEELIDGCSDEEESALYEERCEAVKRLQRMMKMTERVCVIDSFIVDKASFLSAYRTGRDIGTLSTAASYFDDADAPGTVSITERGTDLYFPRMVASDEGSALKLFHCTNVNGKWTDAKQLQGIETGGNDNYPFMAVDGSTFYFASDGEGSIGGYDLFVTRYDTENDRYLRPDNLGMPFNSTANDYMLAINEVANLGWFATDRNQPEGKVCVYVFIPNKENKKLDSEQFDYKARYAYATIASVSVTQTDETAVRKARQQLAMLHYAKDNVDKKGDFLFVVDDQRDYRTFSDFKSEKARTLFRELLSRKKVHAENLDLLELRRDEYATSNASKKNRLAAGIISLEEKVEKEHTELQKLEREVRRLEHEKIYK